ncbi:leader peptide processing enzyme [Bullifex porci]|uniref:Leader peptide processing enzyme n=1 Tax=Bullifex porci TaxID=2606638 RepID=A0A7X2PEJ1_9SPIO|nr:leader peptide processing enzyme [Bullifex porci]MDD7588574.1 leader peptide processing enzyme [Bullifex porci]MSU06948.1 leader peptide processing enzyme [Bullifex porci]
MSKKTNSLIFMLLATLLNLVLLIVFFILGFVILNLVISAMPENVAVVQIGVVLVFVFAIGLSFFVYSRIVSLLTKKFNLEEKLDPLFVRKGSRRPKGE